MRSIRAASSSAERIVPRWLMATLLVIVVCRGLLWSVATPMWQAPDEPAHFSYVEQLRWHPEVFGGHVFHSAAVGASFQTAEPGPVAPGVLTESTLRETRADVEHIDPADGAHATDFDVSAGGYPPFYYFVGAGTMRTVDAAGGSYLTSIQVQRLLGVLFTAVAFVLQVGVVGRLLCDRFRVAAAATIMALLPMVGFATTTINPDTAMALWFAAALCLAFRIYDHGVTRRRVVAIVAVTAAALLTKPTAVVLAPVLLLLAITACGTTGERWTLRRRMVLALSMGIGALTPSQLFARLDKPVGTAALLVDDTRAQLGTDSLGRYARMLPDSFADLYNPSFWANYGWLDTRFAEDGVYWYLAALAVAGFVGVVVRVIRARRVPMAWLLSLAPVVALVVVVTWIEFALVFADRGLFIQGRYFFPLLPVLVAALLSGVGAVTRWPALGRGVTLGIVALTVALAVESWVMLVLPRYSL